MRRAVRAFVLLGSTLLGAASPGAAAGTAELLRDINVVEATTLYGISDGVAGPLVPAGNRIVFPASAPGAGGLWSSDGAALGTWFLRDIATNFYFFETVRQTALFAAGDQFGPTPTDLWRSDGTAEGTFPLSSAGAGSPTA
jgi:hypothetical protein